jgi:hypothetical protein
MVHLLVLAVVVASDDCFLVTTFMSFAFGGREDICMEKGVSVSTSYNNDLAFSRWLLLEKKRSFMEKRSKAKEFGCQFLQGYLFYAWSYGGFLLGRHKARDTPFRSDGTKNMRNENE